MPRSIRPAPAPRSLPSLRALACALLLAGAAAPEAWAQALPGPVRAYALPAQPLGAALNALARQAGVAISVDARLVAGRSAPALTGEMSLREALDRLLAGSGLRADVRNGVIVLQAQAPAGATPAASRAPGERTMGEVRVVADTPSIGTFRHAPDPGPVEPGIVTAATVERFAADDLEDLFSGQAEVAVGGGHGVAQKLYLRGIEDTLLNVTIDGATQAAQAFHHTGRIQLEPELLRQVEVRPGTGDATAGPGALGGLVRFTTKDPEDLLRPGQSAGALAKAAYYSNTDGTKLHSTVYGRFSETLSGMAALTHQDFNDYEDGAGRTVANTGARQQLGFLKLVSRPAAGHVLRLSYDRHHDKGERTQRPQWVTSSFNPAYPLRTERATWNLGYAWRPAGNPAVDVQANVFRTESELEQNVIGRWGRYQGRVQSTGLDVRNTSHFGQHALTYGVDHRSDRITAGPATAPTSEREKGRVTGLFVQDHWAVAPGVDVSVGARYDRYALDDTNRESFDADGLSPNVSVRWAATPQLALLAGHARALRGPKIRDAFKLDAISNDADLQPERASTNEAGFEYRAAAGWRLNGKAYLTTIRNAINDPIGRPTLNENVGTLRSRGVLLHAGYEWRQVRVGAAFHRNRVTLAGEPLNAYDHNGLGASQGNTLTANVDWSVAPGLEVGWLGRMVRSIDSLGTPVGAVRKPGYGVHDVYATCGRASAITSRSRWWSPTCSTRTTWTTAAMRTSSTSPATPASSARASPGASCA